MEEQSFSNDYFRQKIEEMRQRLYAMDGFSPIENVSENFLDKDGKSSVSFVKTNEKVNS